MELVTLQNVTMWIFQLFLKNSHKVKNVTVYSKS